MRDWARRQLQGLVYPAITRWLTDNAKKCMGLMLVVHLLFSAPDYFAPPTISAALARRFVVMLAPSAGIPWQGSRGDAALPCHAADTWGPICGADLFWNLSAPIFLPTEGAG